MSEDNFGLPPPCYKIGLDGFCEALWSNQYWSYKKCRFCRFFCIEWCGTCKWIRFSGPHATCGHPSMGTDFHGWMSMKDSGYATSKDKIGQKSNCSMYERG